MDYVARARDAARRWREAQGLPTKPDLLSLSALSSPAKRRDTVGGLDPAEESQRVAREGSATEATKATKDGGEGGGGLPVAFDPTTLREILGPRPDPAAVAVLCAEVRAVIRHFESEIRTGIYTPGVLLVRGRPVADFLDLDTVARLLNTVLRGKR